MEPFADSPSKMSAEEPLTLPPNSPISKWQATHESWKLFDELRSRGCFCDIVLKSSDGVSFPAHRLIICTCSEYFRSLFSGRWRKEADQDVNLPEIRSNILEKVIKFAYSREVELSSDLQAKELLLAANHLCIEGLSSRCIEYLSERICASNCVSLWSFSKMYCCIKLEAVAEDFLLKNFLHVALSQKFEGEKHLMNLKAEELLTLIDKNQLCVENEGVVFFLLMRWFSENPNKKDLLMLLHGIRWSTLPLSYIVNIILTHPVIKKSRQLRAFVKQVIEMRTNKKEDQNGNQSMDSSSCDSSGKSHNTMLELRDKFDRPRDCQHLIFVVGGWCGKSPTNSVEVHDPKQKTWIHATPVFPQFLERRRAYHAVAEVDGWIYVIGGFDGFTIYNSCDRYNIETSKWMSMCGMAKRRCYVAVTQTNGRIFAIGGSDEMPSDTRLRSVECFSPILNTWSSLPDMREQRSDAGACFMKNQIFVAGGFTGKECVSSVEYYNFENCQWSNLIPMTVPRSGVSVVSYLGGLVVLGGFDGHARLRTVEYFDFDSQSWQEMPRMITKRSNFSSCVVGHKLYVMGGFNDPTTCSETECFTNSINQHDNMCCQNCYASGNKNSYPSPNKQQNREKMTGEGDFSHTSSNMGDESEWNAEGLPLCNCQLEYTTQHLLNMPREVHNGKWESLPSMVVERSAHSCCVVSNFSTNFLHRLHALAE